MPSKVPRTGPTHCGPGGAYARGRRPLTCTSGAETRGSVCMWQRVGSVGRGVTSFPKCRGMVWCWSLSSATRFENAFLWMSETQSQTNCIGIQSERHKVPYYGKAGRGNETRKRHNCFSFKPIAVGSTLGALWARQPGPHKAYR